jgi:hypothetical protein
MSGSDQVSAGVIVIVWSSVGDRCCLSAISLGPNAAAGPLPGSEATGQSSIPVPEDSPDPRNSAKSRTACPAMEGFRVNPQKLSARRGAVGGCRCTRSGQSKQIRSALPLQPARVVSLSVCRRDGGWRETMTSEECEAEALYGPQELKLASSRRRPPSVADPHRWLFRPSVLVYRNSIQTFE